VSANKNVPSPIDPGNCAVVLIDYQPQMAFGVSSIDVQTLVNNATALARSVNLFDIPTIITSIAESSFSGPVFRQIRQVLPGLPILERTNMNLWEDTRVVDAINQTRRPKLILAGMWTEVCVALPALDALREGREVYIVADACGGTSRTAHELGLERILQAGGIPLTWLQFLLELQRDWARSATYDAVLDIAQRHAGPYGLGVQFARAMLADREKEHS
jgi:nicotinamidase-related amidase